MIGRNKKVYKPIWRSIEAQNEKGVRFSLGKIQVFCPACGSPLVGEYCPYIPIIKVLKKFKILKNFFLDIWKYLDRINLGSKHLSEKKIKTIKKLYDSCVYYDDLIVRKLFLFLKNNDLLNNTNIIITSDHGEHLCDKSDHYLWEHTTYQSVYESVIKVPLVIYNSKFNNKIVKNQVQLKDIFHTILHLTGISSTKNKYLSLKNSILFQIKNNTTPKYIFGEYLKSKETIINKINKLRKMVKPSIIPKLINNTFFLRTNTHKYIMYEDKFEEFYDILKDPHEQLNLKDEYSKKYLKMKLKIQKLMKTTKNSEESKNVLILKEKAQINKIIKKIRGL